jgi:hypothetical protein
VREREAAQRRASYPHTSFPFELRIAPSVRTACFPSCIALFTVSVQLLLGVVAWRWQTTQSRQADL